MPKNGTTFPCETGNASFNGEEAAVTVTIKTTDNFSIDDVDELLNNQRLDFTLRMTPQDGEDPKQKKLLDDGHAHARAEIDVGGYSRADAAVSFRVKIPKDRMNGFHSDDFGPGIGFLVVHGHGPVPEKVKVTSKPANGQGTFEDHPDTGPRPKTDDKPKLTALEEDAFKRGCEAGLLGRTVTCPRDLKGDLKGQWQRGYDETRAQ